MSSFGGAEPEFGLFSRDPDGFRSQSFVEKPATNPNLFAQTEKKGADGFLNISFEQD